MIINIKAKNCRQKIKPVGLKTNFGVTEFKYDPLQKIFYFFKQKLE
jgi:hypothetical protein